MDTLVLNFSYMPVSRTSWSQAINMVLNGRAEMLEAYSDKVIRSFSQVFPMPSVIRFLRQAKGHWNRRIAFNRKNIWVRDKGLCQYCGQKVAIKDFTFDHVLPISQGGKTVWENIVVACVDCNQKKAGQTPAQARMRLKRNPVKPSYLPSVNLLTLCGEIPESWKEYLGSDSYWNEALI